MMMSNCPYCDQPNGRMHEFCPRCQRCQLCGVRHARGCAHEVVRLVPPAIQTPIDAPSDRSQTIDRLIADEREACAKIAEAEPVHRECLVGRDLLTVDNAYATKRAIAASIRARRP
jgi:hypothetical protein